MNYTDKEIEKVQREAVRLYIKTLLLHFHENRMDGKGFDFFFALSTDLDEINKKND